MQIRTTEHDSSFSAHWWMGSLRMYDDFAGKYVEIGRGDWPEWVKSEAIRQEDRQKTRGAASDYAVSFFQGLKHPRPLPRTLGWRRLCEALGRWRQAEKADLPLWSAATWPEGSETCKASDVEAVSAIVLDYDGGDLEGCIRRWGRWRSIVHTSASHTPSEPRWRVVIPLAQAIPAADWPKVWRWADKWAPGSDPKARDVGRRYFLPGGADRTHWRFLANEHAPILHVALDRLPPEPEPVRVQRPASPHTLGQDDARRELAERLKTEPALRSSWGIRLGGRVAGAYVRDVRCPGCGRDSVYWPVDPQGTPQGLCHHRNSCGWSGWLDTLSDR